MNDLIIAALRAQVIVLETRAECLRSYPMNVAFNLEAVVIDKQVDKINAHIADLVADGLGEGRNIQEPLQIKTVVNGPECLTSEPGTSPAFLEGKVAFGSNPGKHAADVNPHFMLTRARDEWFGGWYEAMKEAHEVHTESLHAKRQGRAYEMGYAAFKNGLDIEQNPQPEDFKAEWDRGWLCAKADEIKGSQPYLDGKQASEAGRPRIGNPHRHGSISHKSWDLGWCDHNGQRGQ